MGRNVRRLLRNEGGEQCRNRAAVARRTELGEFV